MKRYLSYTYILHILYTSSTHQMLTGYLESTNTGLNFYDYSVIGIGVYQTLRSLLI